MKYDLEKVAIKYDLEKVAAVMKQESEDKDKTIARLTSERDKARDDVASLKRELVKAYLLIDATFKDNWKGVDGPVYNAGRLEGQADMCAELRAIIDPEDKNHWNKDGIVEEIGNLVKIRASIESAKMEKP